MATLRTKLWLAKSLNLIFNFKNGLTVKNKSPRGLLCGDLLQIFFKNPKEELSMFFNVF